MRIVIWNVKNGLGRAEQISYLKSFNPDIAILPELRHHNISGLKPNSFVWKTNNPDSNKPMGLGVLAFGDIGLELLKYDPEMEIFLPIRVTSHSGQFNLIAVWNFYSAAKRGRFKKATGKQQVEFAMAQHYSHMFGEPTLIAGDWNISPLFKSGAFFSLNKDLERFSIYSMYHKFHGIALDQEMPPTHRSSKKAEHSIDHFFGTQHFVEAVTDCAIQPLAESVLSDHALVVMDFNENLLSIPLSAWQSILII